MSETRFTRKLATIIAVDVCGYARLVEENEDRAIAAGDECRALIASVIDRHGGRIFNHAGDGVMAETPSAVEGVRAAFQIQRELQDLNALHPDREPLCVRIGVNLGDVVTKPDGDLAGHGVNIASRLEALAEPGETLISHAVFEQVRGTVEELFEDAGYEKLKNINAPVGIYRALSVQGGKPEARAPAVHRIMGVGQTPIKKKAFRLRLIAAGLSALALGAGLLWALGRQPTSVAISERTIAVLPFTNMSEDSANQFFSDGVTEEILSALVRLEDVTVIGRSSSFQFRDGETSSAEIGNRLGASHLLEGSVRREGDRVRVSAKLVDTTNGVHLWSDSYDRHLDDVFLIQEAIADDIAMALKARLSDNGTEEDVAIPRDVYDLYLRGRYLLSQRGAALPQAVAIFETVTQQAEDFSDGWASLATALHVQPAYTGMAEETVAERAIAAANRALALHPDNASALAVLGAQKRRQGDWPGAEGAFRRALDLEPSNISALYWYGEFLLSVGRIEEARTHLLRAKAIDPLAAYTSAGLGWALYFSADIDGAAREFDEAWTRFGLKVPYVWEGLYSLALDKGDYPRARQLIAELPMPEGIKALHEQFITALEVPTGENIDGLRQIFAALDNAMPVPYYWRYEAYARLGLSDEALSAAEIAVTAGAVRNYQALFTPSARALWDDPRFQAITENLGLTAYWDKTAWPPFCAHAPQSTVCGKASL